MKGTERLLVFTLESPSDAPALRYAIEVTRVLQVFELAHITGVPLAGTVVQGVVNHQGRIVTVLSLAGLLGQEERDHNQPHVVLLRRENQNFGNIGLLVESILGIVPFERFEEVDIPAGPCISLIAQDDEGLVHLLDLQPLFEGLGVKVAPNVEQSVR